MEQIRNGMIKPLRILEEGKAKVGFMTVLFKALDGFIDNANKVTKKQRNTEMEACG